MNTNRMRNWIEANSGKAWNNFIDGKWVPANGGKTRVLYESALPDRILGYFPDSQKEDAEQAVLAADASFGAWKKSSAAERAGILYRFADLLENNREEIAYILSAEQGKVLGESLGEVQRAASEARFAAGEAYRAEGLTLPSDNAKVRSQVIRHPIGVVAAIAPWNFPVVTPVRKLAPALAYGCTVVLKPASLTPWSSVKIVELLAEAGVSDGVVNLVIGSGANAGEPLAAHPSVKGISFTGSTALGLRINGIAASRLAKTQLEMGGKNAAIVLDFEDLAYAADQIVSAAFTCTGQRCTAISRVIVLQDRAEALVQHIQERMRHIRVGPAWSGDANMGPLIDRQQYETVAQYIETGVREGARLILGGQRLQIEDGRSGERQGYYISPALFADVRPDMSLAKEEIFGPVLSVLEARNIDEAVEIANATEYGLAASVFTHRLDWAQTVSEAVECGMIHINHGTASQAHMPFGGQKMSGFGAFSIGHTNQDFYTSLKAVYTKCGDD